MLFIIRYLFGFFRIVVSGPYENFLNLLSKRGITMWGTKKCENFFEISVPRSQVDIVKKSAVKSSVHIESISERGLIAIMKRNKDKLSLFAGIGAFFLMIHVLSMYVWVINVSGNVSVPSDEIISAAFEVGLREGTWKKNFPASCVEQELMCKFQDVSWMSVNIQGCVANVVVKERTAFEKLVPDEEDSHIVAKIDGEIAEMQVELGTPEVKVGDRVTKGALLVSGMYGDEGSDIAHTCHATAKIMANTFHEFHASVDMYQEKSRDFGKKIAVKKLRLFGIDIPLTPTVLPEDIERYSLQSNDKVAQICNVKLPFSLHTDLWKEQEKNIELISEQEAYRMLNEKIEEFENTELRNIQIIYKEQDDKIVNDKLYTSIMYYCCEDISEQVPFSSNY